MLIPLGIPQQNFLALAGDRRLRTFLSILAQRKELSVANAT